MLRCTGSGSNTDATLFCLFDSGKSLKSLAMKWEDRLVSTPDALKGKPRIRGTRIPVALILGFLAEGASTEAVMEEFPGINKDDVLACISYAR